MVRKREVGVRGRRSEGERSDDCLIKGDDWNFFALELTQLRLILHTQDFPLFSKQGPPKSPMTDPVSRESVRHVHRVLEIEEHVRKKSKKIFFDTTPTTPEIS